MLRLSVADETREWIRKATGLINGLIGRVEALEAAPSAPSHEVASLPAPVAGRFIYVPDESGGPTLAFSDGADWRRVSDGAVVS